uniref:Conorfamide protein n=1 Tax=Conus frigidus TaxID=101755 RepID=A0AA50LTC5_CONFG|nr:conorfamide precursor protein [Conus frigidus]
MSGFGFLLLALLLLVTVENETNGMATTKKPTSSFVRIGRRDMQSPFLSERLRNRALEFPQPSSQKQ